MLKRLFYVRTNAFRVDDDIVYRVKHWHVLQPSVKKTINLAFYTDHTAICYNDEIICNEDVLRPTVILLTRMWYIKIYLLPDVQYRLYSVYVYTVRIVLVARLTSRDRRACRGLFWRATEQCSKRAESNVFLFERKKNIHRTSVLHCENRMHRRTLYTRA